MNKPSPQMGDTVIGDRIIITPDPNDPRLQVDGIQHTAIFHGVHMTIPDDGYIIIYEGARVLVTEGVIDPVPRPRSTAPTPPSFFAQMLHAPLDPPTG